MPLRVRYPKVTGQIFDALGIYDTYNQDFGVLIAVRLFLGGSNTYSDPIPVADVDVIGGIGSGGGGSGVSSINGISGNLNIAAGSGIDVAASGNTLTITATGGGTVTNEAIDDRVAALLQAGPNISLNYNDAANTLTISASAIPVVALPVSTPAPGPLSPKRTTIPIPISPILRLALTIG
jgi:hypothetical protein